MHKRKRAHTRRRARTWSRRNGKHGQQKPAGGQSGGLEHRHTSAHIRQTDKQTYTRKNDLRTGFYEGEKRGGDEETRRGEIGRTEEGREGREVPMGCAGLDCE